MLIIVLLLVIILIYNVFIYNIVFDNLIENVINNFFFSKLNVNNVINNNVKIYNN